MPDYIRLSDVPLVAYERINETMSDSYCPYCNKRREVKLPDQPSGFGECLTCGNGLDIWDTSERGERTRYLSNYRP